jgi:S1-C subfamily serine protease
VTEPQNVGERRPEAPETSSVGWPRRGAVVALALWTVVVTVFGAWLVVRLESRSDRLDEHLRAARAEAAASRSVAQDLSQEVRELSDEVDSLQGRVPPDIPRLVARAKRSIFTVHAGDALGTGFAISTSAPDGYETAILTNEHVIEEATSPGGPAVFVSHGSSRIEARLWTWDDRHDLALLYVREAFPPLEWASQEGHDPQVGEFVVAIGSPFGLEGSTSTGIISKIFADFIQTDAAVNPGNSGGPLLNRYGEVVGVVSYRLSEAENINFAVPIEIACERILRCD